MLTIVQIILLLILGLAGSYIGIVVLTKPLFIFWSGLITGVCIVIINYMFEYIKENLYKKR